MKFYKIIALATVLMAMAGNVAAQDILTPYSKVGYGIISDNASGIQRSMGGVGYAMQDGRTVNTMNPAAYSQVDSLTFLWDFGLDLTNMWAKENDNSGHSLAGGIDYLTSQFRIAKHLGGSFGLVPYSTVGYSFGNDITGGNEYRLGSGGLVQLYAGAGYEPIKNLSVGANVSYLFGTISNSNTVTSSSTTLFQRTMQVRDYNLNVGVQYAINLNKNDRVVLGATYSPKKSLHGNSWGSYYDTQDTKLDSVGFTNMNGKYEQPHTIGAGVSYKHKNNFMAEADFTFQNWADTKYTPIEGFEPNNMKFDNRWKAAVGMQFSPNMRASYLGAMKFRAGAFYNHDYINIMGNNVRDYGASVGVGLPVPGINGKTTINLGFEWKHRTSSPTVLVKEDYFNITLGINVNEVWFWKNKIR